MRKTAVRKFSNNRVLYCAVSSQKEYNELLTFIYNVRPIIAARFNVKERLVIYLKLAKKCSRDEIRDRTGISVRKVRKILQEMYQYFS